MTILGPDFNFFSPVLSLLDNNIFQTNLLSYCTNIESLKAPPGHVAIFDSIGMTWPVVEDHRGKIVYDIRTG